MPRKDTLAQGAASASYGPISVSQQHWESIFGKAEAKVSPLDSVSRKTPEKSNKRVKG
jgi:hypothetical protein